MNAVVPAHVLRRLAEDESLRQKGQSLLRAAVLGMRHLSDDLRAEGERLIALPYGAEEYALRAFVAENVRVA